MQKTIPITGLTGGLGPGNRLAVDLAGAQCYITGAQPGKTQKSVAKPTELSDSGRVDSDLSDLSEMKDAGSLAKTVTENYTKIEVLIKNVPDRGWRPTVY